MSRYSITLTANETKRVPMVGRVLQLVDTGVATSVGLKVEFASQQQTEDFGECSNKFRLVAAAGFSGIELLSTTSCTVEILASVNNVSVSDFDGTSLSATIDPAQLPLPVLVDDTVPIAVEIVASENGGAEVASYPGAVTATDAGVTLLAADVDYKRVVLYNAGSNPVGLSRTNSTAKTLANCGIVLSAGATYIEERFAGLNLAYKGRCDTGLTSSVQVEYIK